MTMKCTAHPNDDDDYTLFVHQFMNWQYFSVLKNRISSTVSYGGTPSSSSFIVYWIRILNFPFATIAIASKYAAHSAVSNCVSANFQIGNGKLHYFSNWIRPASQHTIRRHSSAPFVMLFGYVFVAIIVFGCQYAPHAVQMVSIRIEHAPTNRPTCNGSLPVEFLPEQIKFNDFVCLRRTLQIELNRS